MALTTRTDIAENDDLANLSLEDIRIEKIRAKRKFKLPKDVNLATLGSLLRTDYKRSNIKRLDCISLYERSSPKIVSDKRVKYPNDLFMGFVSLYLELGMHEYNFRDPMHSQFFSSLVNRVGITAENSLEDDERYVYLGMLFRYINKITPDEFKPCQTWQTKEAFAQAIHDALKRVDRREKRRKDLLIHRMPDLNILEKNIDETEDEYTLEVAKRWFPSMVSSNRAPAKMLVRFVRDCCKKMYDLDTSKEIKENREGDDKYLREYLKLESIHRGLSIFIPLQIWGGEYKYLPAERSAYYRIFMEKMSCDSLDDYTLDQRIDWLTALKELLADVQKLKPALVAEWKKQDNFPDLDKVALDIEQNICQLMKKKHEQSTPVRLAGAVLRRGTHYAVSAAAARYLTGMALPAITGGVGTLLAGPLGTAIGLGAGIAGTFAAAELGRFLSQTIVPSFISNLYVTVIDRIASTLGDGVARLAFATFRVTKGGLARMLGFYNKFVDDNFSEEWIQTLLEMPDDIVKQEEKKRICTVWGLKMPEAATMREKNPQVTLLLPKFSFLVKRDYETAAPVLRITAAPEPGAEAATAPDEDKKECKM